MQNQLDIKYILGALIIFFLLFVLIQLFYKSSDSSVSGGSSASLYGGGFPASNGADAGAANNKKKQYYFQRGGATDDAFDAIITRETTDPFTDAERRQLARQGLGALSTPGILEPVDTSGQGAVTGQYLPGSTPTNLQPGLQAGVQVDPLTGLYGSEALRNTRNPYAIFASGPEPRTVDPALGGFGPEGVNNNATAPPGTTRPREIYQDLGGRANPNSPRYRYGFDDIDLINDTALPGVKKFCQKWGVTPDQLTDDLLDNDPTNDGNGLQVGPDGTPVKVEPRPGGSPSTNPNPNPGNNPPNGSDSCDRIVTVPEKVACVSDGDCNVVFGQGGNKCLDGKCRCNSAGTGTFCHLKSDYYKKLSEMTPAQIVKFKKTAKLEKMTIRDYLKWLSLFKYDIENLPRQHLSNFNRYLNGLPIYTIPLSDPTEEFFASSAAKQDRVCLTIPNAEVDSPMNYKIRSTLDSTGQINVLEETQRPLNFSKYYNTPALAATSVERNNDVTLKDWFFNNINWMFNDVDKNALYRDPQRNRFLNIIDQTNAERIRAGQVRPGATAQRLATQTSGLLPTQENVITPTNNISNYASAFDENPVDLRTGLIVRPA